MYEVEKFGGRQIRKSDSACYIVQFDTLQNMEAWMKMMRILYRPNMLAWAINREALVIVL